MPQALVIEDDSGHRGALRELIETEGFEVAAVGTLADARREGLPAGPDLSMEVGPLFAYFLGSAHASIACPRTITNRLRV